MESEPPHVEAAEAAILSIAFDQPEKYIPKLRAQGVNGETFWKWRALSTEIFRFYDDNGTTETVAFHQDLLTRGEFDRCGGGDIFDIIGSCTSNGYGWSKWVEQLKEAHALRIARNLHLSYEPYETSEDAEKSLSEALEAIKSAKTGPMRSYTAKEAADSFLEQFIANREAGEIPGKSTGIAELDAICGGMRPGELWVICGETSRGKSVLMLQMVAEVINSGGNVAIFSIEMSKEEIIARLVSLVARIDFGKIMQPRLLTAKHDFQKLIDTVKTIAKANLWISDMGDQSADYIASECGHLADEYGQLDAVMVDYIQLIEGSKGRGESREQEIAGFSRKLKQLAKRFHCPVITGSQLNELGKTRESRAISHDANSMLFIAEDGVKIGKMRNGKRDSVIPLFLHGQFQKFQPFKPNP